MRVLFILYILLFNFSAFADKKIYITQIIQHPALDRTRQGIIDELNENYCKREICDIKFDDAQGNIALAAQIAQNYKAKNVDVAVALGTPVAQVFKSKFRNSNSKVVFSSITDPISAGLVKNLNMPESNVTGVSNFIAIEPQLEFYLSKFPNLKIIGIIYNPSEANSVKLNELIIEKAGQYGLKIVTSAANKTSDVAGAARHLAEKADAILVTNDNTALSAFSSIVKIAQKNNKLVFVSDIDMMPKGADASIGPDQYELGRQTGRMIINILQQNGDKMPAVEFPKRTETKIQ